MCEKNFVAPTYKYKEPFFVRGKGSYVFDVNGKRYLDISCGQFSAVLGHSNESVKKMLCKSADELIHLSTTVISKNVVDASCALHERMPGMDSRILLLSTGAEANEACLRYAKNMSGNKPGVVSFIEGYHGLTHGTEGYSINRKWVKPPLNYSFGVHVPKIVGAKSIDEEYKKTIDEFKIVVEQNKDVIACALFEPIISNGGLIYPEKQFWKEIRKICDENGIFLVFDECQTGFGRTGTWFYYEQLECVPDMLVSAKAMGLGFPVSMVAFNGNKFKNDMFKMNHFSSHQNEPFSAELVLTGIEVIEKENLLNNIVSMGDYLIEQLEILSFKFPIIKFPRGKGLICGFDLDLYDLSPQEVIARADKLVEIARENGLLLQVPNYGATVRILPAYNVTNQEIDEFITILGESLESLGLVGYKVK